MLQIEDTIISRDIFDKKFLCNLNKCKGECCVEGDGGAPLTVEECSIIEENIEKIKPFMRKEGIQAIGDLYMFIFDEFENEIVTPLVNHKECAYAYFEDGICLCAIEKAYLEKKIDFIKPVSCHLYPIRLKEYDDFTAVNYHEWDICQSACVNGNRKDVYLFDFLKTPLIRKFGEEWYKDLVNSGKELGWIKKK